VDRLSGPPNWRNIPIISSMETFTFNSKANWMGTSCLQFNSIQSFSAKCRGALTHHYFKVSQPYSTCCPILAAKLGFMISLTPHLLKASLDLVGYLPNNCGKRSWALSRIWPSNTIFYDAVKVVKVKNLNHMWGSNLGPI